MELMLVYSLLLGFGLNGLIFMGMLYRYQLLERRLTEAVRQFNIVAISRGNR